MLAAAAVQRRIDEYRDAVDQVITGIAAELQSDAPIDAAMVYALAGGGKRLRPIMCLAALDAVNGDARAPHAVRAAAALELIHTYSLVHDDLPCMDDDDLRRGRATTHRVYGPQIAMAAGCALIPIACRILMDSARAFGLSDRDAGAAVSQLCTAAGAAGMVGGQVADLEGEGVQVQLEALRHIHRLKTGALFAASLRIGGLLGGAGPAQQQALGTYGEHVGLAFQIRDDVLDVTKAAAVLGKTPGKDGRAHKASFAALLGPEGAQQAAVQESESAIAALRAAGVDNGVLTALAQFAVTRNR